MYGLDHMYGYHRRTAKPATKAPTKAHRPYTWPNSGEIRTAPPVATSVPRGLLEVLLAVADAPAEVEVVVVVVALIRMGC